MSEAPTVRRAVVVPDRDPLGLHLRPARLLVQLALKYKCKVEIIRDTLRVDCKSIFDVLTLAAEPGVTIEFEAVGDDAEAAIACLTKFVEDGFECDETQGP
ncbi:MAG TPA: HPr family phosphocarrier protein [Lacipirellulaceae bacterium]|nr:HPr family phosphocarrier protein [Lacipirellulaceae bacterium]